MYPLIRRYLRRVDVVYLLLCAACSAISIAVLLSIGQTQLGSNNKASVQLIASLLGLMLAAVFSTADYHALARAWPLHGVVAWGLVLPTLFLHNVNTGLVTIGYDAGGTSNYSWYRVGGMTFQPAELAKISFILTLALHLSRVRGQVNRPKNLLLLFVHIALPAAAIHVQGDDGTALVFLGIGLVMLYAGGLSHWLVAGGLTAGLRSRCRQALGLRDDSPVTRWWQMLVTFLLSTLAWVFFKAASLSSALAVLRGMVSGPLLVRPILANTGLDRGECLVALLCLAALLAVDLLSLRRRVCERFLTLPRPLRWVLVLALLLTVAVFGVYGTGYDAQDFIYFKF